MESPKLDDRKAETLKRDENNTGEGTNLALLSPSQVVRDPRILTASDSFSETEFIHKHEVYSGIGECS